MLGNHHVTLISFMSMMKFGRHESGKSSLRRIKNNRKWDGNMFWVLFASIRKKMELMGIHNVAKNHLIRIKQFRLLLLSAFATGWSS